LVLAFVFFFEITTKMQNIPPLAPIEVEILSIFHREIVTNSGIHAAKKPKSFCSKN
jgi:hypothetical protein